MLIVSLLILLLDILSIGGRFVVKFNKIVHGVLKSIYPLSCFVTFSITSNLQLILHF